MNKCWLFHDWDKWEQYTWRGKVMQNGLLVHSDERGKWFETVMYMQTRRCKDCGKVEKEEIL